MGKKTFVLLMAAQINARDILNYNSIEYRKIYPEEKHG